MKYVGGKQKMGSKISEYMMKHINPSNVNGYLEPFVGGCGVFKNMVEYNFKTCIGSDFHKSLIMMWVALQKNTLIFPKNISEKMWKKFKNEKTDSALKGLFGFGLSFGGDYFSGYIQKYAGTSGRDFYVELKNSLKSIQQKINKNNVKFYHKKYNDWKPTNMLIYCDPPYKDTTQYKVESFDHNKFWENMRQWSKNNYVFISEENAPKDFKCVWKQSKLRSLTPDKEKMHVSLEKLYVYKKGKLSKLKAITNV